MIISSIPVHSCNSLKLHTYLRTIHRVLSTSAACTPSRSLQLTGGVPPGSSPGRSSAHSPSPARPPAQATTGCPSAHQTARRAGYAKEGGALKASGSKFELLQEYREFKRGPGGVLLEEVEDAPVRGFDILALTPDTLMLKLATTSYTDEESGRRVTVQPDGDYFLVWTKAGAATQRAPAAVEEEEDEQVRTSRRAAVLHLLLSVGRLPPP